MKTPFLGSAYTSRSSNLAGQRLVNLYPEVVETKEGKEVGAFYGTPGLDLLATIGTGPIRGEHTGPGGILYVVSGYGLYSIDKLWGQTLVGTLKTTNGIVSIIDNGSQVAVFDGVDGYCWTGAVFMSLSMPFDGPTMAVYQDGFGLVTQAGTQSWWQSNYRDLTAWNSLNFGQADSKPDPIVGIGSLHREVWLFGSSSTEVWVDAGTSGFAFQRLQGVFLEVGCVAPQSVSRMGETMVWLGQSIDGNGIVYRSGGYTAQRISTHAIESAIGGYRTIADAIGYSYQDGGHQFYVLTFPGGDATWVYDSSTAMWHERAGWFNGSFRRHAGNAYAFAFGRHVVGDWRNGNIYAFNLDTYTDAGDPKKWLRSWRALPPGKATDTPITFHALRIDCETGIHIADGANPQFSLRWTDDGGHTWSNEHLSAWGKIGETAKRVKWNRLGGTRRNSGMDRVFEVSSTDAVRAALIAAEMDAS